MQPSPDLAVMHRGVLRGVGFSLGKFVQSLSFSVVKRGIYDIHNSDENLGSERGKSTQCCDPCNLFI